MLKRLVFLAVIILMSVPAFAESVDTAWVRRYNGPADSTDYASAIAVDDSGYVYVTGYIFIGGSDYDYATIKYYPNGDTVWVRRYDGPDNGDDKAFHIAVDGSGNVCVTGYSHGTGTGYDYATIKYQPDGDTAWVRRYNGSENGDDRASPIAVDGSGYVYVAGRSRGSGTLDDYVTIKYHPDGDTAWVRRYNGPGNGDEYAARIAVDNGSNVYVTGYSAGSGTARDYATIKYNPDGDTAWVRRYNGPTNYNDDAVAMVVDSLGNIYVTGHSEGSGTSDDFATIKYYPDGDTAWVRRYNGPSDSTDWATGIAVTDSGYVYVTGYSRGTGSSEDYATIKYNSSGNQLWVERFNCANGSDKPTGIALDGSDNIYVTGQSGCGGTTGFDYVTIEYYPSGDTAWLRKYHGPVEYGYDYAYALAVDTSENVYVTGQSRGDGTGYDYCTIKYVQTPSAVEDEFGDRERPSGFDLSQNYPNPFNPSTIIRFKVQGSKFKVTIPTTLIIYNILGEVVKTLVDGPKWAGDYSVHWDGKNDKGEQLSSGVYFYQLKTGYHTYSKKMILLK